MSEDLQLLPYNNRIRAIGLRLWHEGGNLPRPACVAKCFCVLVLGCAVLVAGQNPGTANPGDLTSKTIQELMNMDVVSVSRKEQHLSKTPAAVYVITQEDIHRSGARTIPDALRMAPGVQVSQLDANRWAVSVRGFNEHPFKQVTGFDRWEDRLQSGLLRRLLGTAQCTDGDD